MMFVSATPNVYERDHELLRVEQIIRPTGLLDRRFPCARWRGRSTTW